MLESASGGGLHPGGVSVLGGSPSQGGSPSRGVLHPGGGGVLHPGRGLPGPGGVLHPGGGVCLVPGGGMASQHALRQTPSPPCGQTHTCKNITLATTSLRPVIIIDTYYY